MSQSVASTPDITAPEDRGYHPIDFSPLQKGVDNSILNTSPNFQFFYNVDNTGILVIILTIVILVFIIISWPYTNGCLECLYANQASFCVTSSEVDKMGEQNLSGFYQV